MKVESSAEEKTQYRSVFRIANILYALSEGLNTVTDIANYCNIDKSTISRLLKALQGPKLVIKDPINHKYYIGHLFTKIFTNPQTSHMDLIFKSVDVLKYLSEISEETTFLSIMVGLQYVRLYQVQSKHQLRFDSIESCRMDMEWPEIVGATAKALVSQVNEKSRTDAIRYFPRKNTVEDHISDDEALVEKLDQVKKRGYYVSYSEKFPENASISAIIDNYTFPAALSIVGPEKRLQPKIEGLIPELLKGTKLISDSLLFSVVEDDGFQIKVPPVNL